MGHVQTLSLGVSLSPALSGHLAVIQFVRQKSRVCVNAPSRGEAMHGTVLILKRSLSVDGLQNAADKIVPSDSAQIA